MKQLNILRTTARNKIAAFSAAMIAFFMTHPVYAQDPKYLKHSKKALDGFQTDLNVIIPIAAAVILLCLAIGYAGRYIGKDTFIRWSIGVIIAGSATQLGKLLFTGAA
ncbi:VirB2 family type IV secretion system major pilin TrwL [Bartonella krasnovii]|uniref:VirB2 family type IV secretion system major pilin TrwL n=1 Tax=Bartonella krasnovii TaxID=2267275 RepID=UPI001F4CD949|nr:VirB2 family type IV secretion system major pilin TrwL [Bartonella krasnovii]UNF46907.1 VirB2 family type IV secretion system major pilin TrwL [Bartonella krasnovii]